MCSLPNQVFNLPPSSLGHMYTFELCRLIPPRSAIFSLHLHHLSLSLSLLRKSFVGLDLIYHNAPGVTYHVDIVCLSYQCILVALPAE
jgi:hypothetical protein